MYKKLLITCIAVAAFAAFAMSASASAASPLLTNASGEPVPVGTGLKATNIGVTKLISSITTVECSNDVLAGPLTANPNSGKPVEGTVESANFLGTEAESNCKSGLGRVRVTTGFAAGAGNGTPWCLSAGAGDVLSVRGGACGSAARPITFVLDIHTPFGVVECHFERTTAKGPVTGSYNTKADLIGKIPSGANSEFVGTSGGVCPTSGTLEMEFGLTTAAGGTLTID
ncbi:MAG TPA: hypothetical protein VGC32_03875 [Solirubrobacterales bacterium]